MKKEEVIIKRRFKRNGIQRYIDKEFAKSLDDMKEKRLKMGIDNLKTIKSDWRLTLAMVRHPKFIMIQEDIINSELK